MCGCVGVWDIAWVGIVREWVEIVVYVCVCVCVCGGGWDSVSGVV